MVAAPVLSQVVRPHLPARGYASPYFDQLDQPVQFLSELTFTGYYPVVPWLAYLLVGIGVGRMDLHGGGSRRRSLGAARRSPWSRRGVARASPRCRRRAALLAGAPPADEPLPS